MTWAFSPVFFTELLSMPAGYLIPFLRSSIPALAFAAQSVMANSWLDIDEDEGYTARHESSLVQAGDRFYSFGGRENSQVLDTYDYANDTWTTSAPAPVPFNHFQATEYQGLVWVIGAFKNNRFPSEQPADYIYTFDPANDVWQQGREIPEDRRRGSAGLVQYQDKFYVVAGNTIGHNGGYVPWFDEYDPETGEWTALEDAPNARDHFHATVVDDKLYVAGGRLSGGEGGIFAPLVTSVDVYDFGSGSWSTLPGGSDLPTPRAGTSTVTFQGNVLVIGGEGDGQAYDTVEQLDPGTNTWAEIAPMNHARHGTQAIVSGDGIFTLGGSPRLGGGSQRNLEAFNSSQAAGEANTPALLGAPVGDVVIPTNGIGSVDVRHAGGNQGALITAMELTDNASGSFELTEQAMLPNLVKVGGSRSVTVRATTDNLGEQASLLITYDDDKTLSIPIRTPFDEGVPPSGSTYRCPAASNIAGTGTASQSSGLRGDRFPAGRAIDGDLTNFTHTATDNSADARLATWLLTFDQDTVVSEIELFNRWNCCGERLRDITVSVLTESGGVAYSSELLNPEDALGSPDSILVTLPAPVLGRSIQVTRTPDPDNSGSSDDLDVSVLSLAEVDVEGCTEEEAIASVATSCEVIDNLALSGEASQSSNFSRNRFPARDAIDDDLGNFTHTARSDDRARLSVVLEAEAVVNEIVLYNRANTAGSRLRDITVTVQDENDEIVYSSALLNPENELGSPARIDVSLPAGTVGSSVSVARTPDQDLSGTDGAGNADESNVLSVGELQILGCVAR